MKASTFPLIILVIGIFGPGVQASTTTNKPIDLVEFFKRAISTPPDIDEFVAGQESFLSGQDLQDLEKASGQTFPAHMPLQFYAGARGGSNYFITRLGTNGDESSPAPNVSQQVIGRIGSVVYSRTSNSISSISIGRGANTFVKVTSSQSVLVNQFLNMGLGDINPQSVRWDGNRFEAETTYGALRYGKLYISNGMPSRLEVYLSASTHAPFKLSEYKYPEPPDLYGGFPAETTLLNSNYSVSARIILKTIHLAPQPLGENFFNHTRFGGTNRIGTNIYDNTDTYFSRKSDGKLLQVGVDIPAE